MESRIFLERNIAELNHEEVSLYNVSPLPIKVEDAAVDDGIGVSEQIETEKEAKVSPYNLKPLLLKVEHNVSDNRIGVSEQVETEQKSKDSAFNEAEFTIKTELIKDEDEPEMSEEAENDQLPKRQDDSFQCRKQMWFQINPPNSEVHAMQSSNFPCESEQSGVENESSNYHLDRNPISNRKLGAEGEVIYSGTCSSASGMDFPEGAADVTRMADRSSGHSEANGYHAGSYKPQKKDLIRDHQRKRSHKINLGQTTVLVNYMSSHRNFAVGKFDSPSGKLASVRQWKVLRDLLNKHGPPKTVEQWKKAWKDIRGRTRAKMARLNLQLGNTRNFTHITPLNELEEKVISIISTKSSVPLIESERNRVVAETNESEESEDCINIEDMQVLIESAESMEEQSRSHPRVDKLPKKIKPNGIMVELKEQIDSKDERSVAALESIASSLKVIAEGQQEIVTLLRKAVEQRS